MAKDNEHFNIYEVIGILVVIAILFFLIHYVTAVGFMYLFAFPAIYLIEIIQNTIFPFLESILPWGIGGYIAIIITVICGVTGYVLIIGLLIFLTIKIWMTLFGSSKRED